MSWFGKSKPCASSMPAFVVGGTDLLRYPPEGFGVVFNPESAEENLIPPALVEQVKAAG